MAVLTHYRVVCSSQTRRVQTHAGSKRVSVLRIAAGVIRDAVWKQLLKSRPRRRRWQILYDKSRSAILRIIGVSGIVVGYKVGNSINSHSLIKHVQTTYWIGERLRLRSCRKLPHWRQKCWDSKSNCLLMTRTNRSDTLMETQTMQTTSTHLNSGHKCRRRRCCALLYSLNIQNYSEHPQNIITFTSYNMQALQLSWSFSKLNSDICRPCSHIPLEKSLFLSGMEHYIDKVTTMEMRSWRSWVMKSAQSTPGAGSTSSYPQNSHYTRMPSRSHYLLPNIKSLRYNVKMFLKISQTTRCAHHRIAIVNPQPISKSRSIFKISTNRR